MLLSVRQPKVFKLTKIDKKIMPDVKNLTL